MPVRDECYEPPAGRYISLSKRGCHLLAKARWMLGYVLVAETAFQYLLKTWSEVLEVLLFTTITGGFLVTTFVLRGFKGLAGIATGTWVQRLATLFLATLALSFLWGDQSLRSLLALFRLPTYLIIIAMVAETLRKEERIPTLAWITVGSITLIYTLAFVEFFFGSEVLGLQCAAVEKCLQSKPENWSWKGLSSYKAGIEDFARHGGIFNSTVIGDAYGMNRLGMFALLAYAPGIGLMLMSGHIHKVGVRMIVGGMMVFILGGMSLSGSRSGLFSICLTCMILILRISWNANQRHHIKAVVLINLVLVASTVSFWRTVPAGITSLDRIFRSSMEEPVSSSNTAGGNRRSKKAAQFIGERGISLDEYRIRNWRYGLNLFLDKPVWGIGFRMYNKKAITRFRNEAYTTRPKENAPIGVHNGYLKVLVEAGLLGGGAFLALLAFSLGTLLRSAPRLSADQVTWQIVFSSASVSMLFINLVDTHSEDRFFWMILAFAAASTHWKCPDC